MAGTVKQLLLVDPHSLFRRTLAMVARDLHLADVQETASLELAQRLLERRPVDGLLMDIGEGLEALNLLHNIRGGATSCATDLPVALTAEHCDLATAQLYKEQGVRRILLKPFKVKTALEVIQDLASA
ncbi:response regulator [Pelomonas sp. BJYL3]|uniref:response regulator n=1 Tax=Pelomonas sp. BJYL3 TaxID=2976697 RepID=UPI0022B2B961|nr:response regulator [Pelomonas sp. BJYL3]